MFGRQDQKASEAEKAYMAKLKCICRKAYPKSDCSTMNEDLLCRFLNGLRDQKTQQQIEFV